MNELIDSLLDTWGDNGKFGLTLPFIVGALRLKGFSDGSVSDSFSSMLKELQTSSIIYRLAYCDKADDLILAPVNRSPDGCKRILANGASTKLWVQHDLVDNNESDNLYNVLWKRYGLDLESERYSCTNGKYHTFTSEDLALVEKAFEKIA